MSQVAICVLIGPMETAFEPCGPFPQRQEMIRVLSKRIEIVLKKFEFEFEIQIFLSPSVPDLVKDIDERLSKDPAGRL
jgi:hypothetical protein